MTEPAVLQARDLTMQYGEYAGTVRAVDGIGLDVPAGQCGTPIRAATRTRRGCPPRFWLSSSARAAWRVPRFPRPSRNAGGMRHPPGKPLPVRRP